MKKIISLVLLLVMFGSVQSLQAQTRKKKSASKAKTSKRSTTVKKQKNMLALLQGRWASTEDQKTFLQIEGDKQISIYGREVLDTSTINFYNEYPVRITDADPKLTSGSYMVVQKNKNDFLVYGVEQITASKVTLMYLPKGSLLHYQKVR
jgi:hypothetical protein